MSECADASSKVGMAVDSLGLAYAARDGRIFVHYPVHESEGRAGSGYQTGFDIGAIPASYWIEPPNEITRERAKIWRSLLDGDGASS